MTWDVMVHEDAKFKSILIDQNKKIVGFSLKGMTYDGDGNIQDDDGTEMEIKMKSENDFLQLINILDSVRSKLECKPGENFEGCVRRKRKS